MANAIGGKPVGRGRWRTDEDETGDNGLSATGINIRIAVLPYDLEASDGESLTVAKRKEKSRP